MAMKIPFPWQLTLFHSPPTSFQYVSDFQLEKINVKQDHKTQANILCLLDHAYEVLLANIKMECQTWPEKLLIWGGGLEPSMLPW